MRLEVDAKLKLFIDVLKLILNHPTHYSGGSRIMPSWGYPQNQTFTETICRCFFFHTRKTPGFEKISVFSDENEGEDLLKNISRWNRHLPAG